MRTNDLILTAGGPAHTVRERYLGGAWRGLLSWGLFRVLEQHSFVPGGATGGVDVSFGNLLSNLRQLTAVVQGIVPDPAVPRLFGSMAGTAGVLHKRVGQLLTAPAGHTSDRSSFIGGGVQVWGDTDELTVWTVTVNNETELAAIVFVYTNSQGHASIEVDTQYMSDVNQQHSTTFTVNNNQESWYFDAAKFSTPPTKYTFTKSASVPRNPQGHAPVPGTLIIPATMYGLSSTGTSPMMPGWSSVYPVAPHYIKTDVTGGFCALKLSTSGAQLVSSWYRTAPANPFANVPVNGTVTFEGELSTGTTGVNGWSATLPHRAG